MPGPIPHDEATKLLELASSVAEVGHWHETGDGRIVFSAEAVKILDLEHRVLSNGRAGLDDALGQGFEAAVASLEEDSGGDGVTTRRLRGVGRLRNKTVEIRVRTGSVAAPQSWRTFGVILDVTQREQLLARLQHAEKIATIGTLAAGIAHEINNPLSYIITNVDLLLEELEAIAGASPSARSRELVEMLHDVRDGTRRIRRIIQGLKSFARSADGRMELVELPRVIGAAHRLCATEIRHRARFIREVSPDTPIVWADEAQMTQVVVNLLVNAAHAIDIDASGEQRITVRCGRHARDKAFLEVEDTGRGMDSAVLRRAFDPFFTTKPVGIGTGLGLAISHGIVTSVGGTITVESEPGIGTMVRVELPAHQGRAPAPLDPGVAGAALRNTTPRGLDILCVDDDIFVLRSLNRLLRGNRVVAINNPREALERLRGTANVDVVICDLMMPEMNGNEFYQQLSSCRPGLADRVVFITGGAFTPEVAAFARSCKAPIITKPVDVGDLRKVLERLLTPTEA
ncbi:MAG: ATP-binding protein [Polyangiaceae bacterium]